MLDLAHCRGDTYQSGKWVCFDLETTNLEYGDARNMQNRIVLASWLESGGRVQSHYGDLMECAAFWEALEQADFCIAQHCKFESHWLYRLAYDASSKLWADPMLFEWVLLGNNPDRLSLSLDALCDRYGYQRKDKFVAALMDGGVCPSEIPEQQLLARCERDVVTTAQVAMEQIALLAEKRQLHLAAMRCVLAPVLADIERAGIGLDADRVRQTHAEFVRRYLDLKGKIDKLSGGINQNAPNEMIPLVYGVFPRVKAGKAWREQTQEEKAQVKVLGFKELKDKRGKPRRNKPTAAWPGGRPKTDKNTIATLAKQARTKKQKDWLKLREELASVNAAITKNLDFYKGIVDERDGWFYGELMQGITATHRLSGRGKPVAFAQFDGKHKSAQPQNQPREFKGLVKARRAKHKISDADAKQLEFRVAAFLGQDEQALADIRNPDFDAHIQTLTIMLNKVFDKTVYEDLLTRYRAGDKEVKYQRNDNKICKSHTYKPLFGGDSGTADETRYYRWFREHYKDITAECERWLKQVHRQGWHRTAAGLIFRFSFVWKQMGNALVAFDIKRKKLLKPAVYNYAIQALAQEIDSLAIICLYYRLKAEGIRAVLINTVHDSVSGEVHEEDESRWVEAVRMAFCVDTIYYLREIYGLDWNVPLGCDISFGDNLGEGKQLEFESEAA